MWVVTVCCGGDRFGEDDTFFVYAVDKTGSRIIRQADNPFLQILSAFLRYFMMPGYVLTS